MAERCRVTASSASSRPARASPSTRSNRRRSRISRMRPSAGSICAGTWRTARRSAFPARIVLQTVNEPGSLAQVAQVIAEHDGNIDNISMERSSPDFTSVTIDLEVFDIKHLNSIIAQLRAKDVVADAERVNA